MTTRKRFAGELPRAGKTSRGRTPTETTPLAIRSRVKLSDELRDQIRARLGRKLDKYALQIERGTVRIDDVNGPKGGVDRVCRIKLVLSGLPSIVVEERGVETTEAVTRAAAVAERTLRRSLERLVRSTRPERGAKRAAATPPARRGTDDDDGSLIGRRVGRGRANLERALARPEKLRGDAYVDTAAPGTSASDRKVGYGATARRNTKRDRSGMTAALEDSRTEPSRKSTRASSNRMPSGTELARKAVSRTLAPSARAARSKARPSGDRPRR